MNRFRVGAIMTKFVASESNYSIDFERIKELVAMYEEKKRTGEIKKYNEESTKKDFILPLFEALGWNVYNKGKWDSSVSAEETISKKRVDYGFRIKGIPKFFLEAKSMKEDDIQTNPKYVTQAIDYAWMKSCSWAILCNFETIAVYNADWKESNYGNNLFFVLHPSDFLTDRRFIYFSKIAFGNNELDKIALKYGKKQLKNPINKQLLEDMIHFREVLSRDVVRNNRDRHLTQDDIDESIQRILDRLIFIRNAEDRGLEENQLQSNVRQWYAKDKGHLVKEIVKIYKDYDNKYNSKLFAHHLCDDLYIDSEALQEVIEGLNHAKDNSYRYDFSIIESDVLGNIYEQYLGNILKSTPRRAKLEESKTHRKEQGIYYTPSYIVDYTVKNTVGEYIKHHTPEEIRKVRIVDPACGSGSFLIRIYKEMEDYWKKKLKIDESGLMQTRFDAENLENVYTLKTEILKNNIFGVDLDPKAVEIAQLNLLLQISERGHKLPLLQSNIKIGNSLIDDFSISGKAFKWEEQFPEIMKEGGFDIVIGNPPYGAELSEMEREFILDKYPANRNNSDTAIAFINRSYLLLQHNGYLGLIVPKPLIYSQKWINARNFIIPDLLNLVDVSKAFEEVLLEQVIIVLMKNSNASRYTIDFPLGHKQRIKVDKRLLRIFGILINDVTTEELNLGLAISKSGNFLSDVAEIERGVIIQQYLKKTGEVPVLRGKNIGRYEIKKFTDFIDNQDIDKLQLDLSYLRRPKIVMQNIIAHVTKPKDHIVIMCAFDYSRLITLDNVGNIFTKGSISPYFIIGLLNSKLINWYAYLFIYAKAIRTMRFDKYHMSKVPLPPSEYITMLEYQRIIERVQELTELIIKMRKLKSNSTDSYRELERKAENSRNDIDNLIYKIYGLNINQISIVEDSFR